MHPFISWLRTHQLNRLLLRFAIIGFLSVVSLLNRLHAEEWTNLRGTSTVVGKLVGIWNGRAILRLEDGRQVLVKLDDLKSDSRIQAQVLQDEIDNQLHSRVAELDAIAAEAAAPAPPTMPTPKPAPGYQPPSDSADLQSALTHQQEQALAGHLRVYYDALPKSYREQTDALFKLGLQKFEPVSWEQVRSTLQRLSEIAVTRQRWLFSHPKFESTSETSRESLLTLAAAFRQWGTAENASLDQLNSVPVADSIAKLDEMAAQFLYQVFEENSAIASLIFPTYQVEAGEAGVMTAKVVLPIVGTTVHSVPMVQVEGRWVEGTSAEDAAAKWASYKTDLEAISDSSIRIGADVAAVFSRLSVLLTKLEEAKSRTAFHRAIDDASVDLGAAITAWAGITHPSINGDAFNSGGQANQSDARAMEEARRRAVP